MSNEISKTEPPALPLAPEQYNRPYMDQNSNVLRLFFNRLTRTLDTLLSTEDGGRFLYMPRALFYSTTNQTAAATGTGYPVEFENPYIVNGISVVSDTRLTVAAAGMYNFQVTMQVDHTNSSDATLTTWINKSGTDVPYGGQIQTLKGNDTKAVYWNFSIDMEPDDYIEMYWATSDTALSLYTEAATALHPGVPSAIVSVSFVSNL